MEMRKNKKSKTKLHACFFLTKIFSDSIASMTGFPSTARNLRGQFLYTGKPSHAFIKAGKQCMFRIVSFFRKKMICLFHISCLPFPVSKVSLCKVSSFHILHVSQFPQFSIHICFRFPAFSQQISCRSVVFLRTPPTTQKNQMAHVAVDEWLVSKQSPSQLRKSISGQFQKKQ